MYLEFIFVNSIKLGSISFKMKSQYSNTIDYLSQQTMPNPFLLIKFYWNTAMLVSFFSFDSYIQGSVRLVHTHLRLLNLPGGLIL